MKSLLGVLQAIDRTVKSGELHEGTSE